MYIDTASTASRKNDSIAFSFCLGPREERIHALKGMNEGMNEFNQEE